MYPISDKLKKLFLDGNKKCVKLTLNGVSFENDVITEADVLSDSLTVDRYCSSGNKIEVGSAIAAELTLTLVNNNEKFGDKIFEGADVALEIGIEGVTDSFIPCGKFTVDEPPRSSFHIKLKALDYMMRFDKRVDLTKLSFPMSVEDLLARICEICEVEISSDISLASLPNIDQTVMNAPASGDLTYRQILQWIAQITGTCAFMDWNGKLCLSWFTDTGMTLTPSLRYIGGNIDENDITISGVTVGTETKGSADYALLIEGNQLIYPGTEEVLAENIYNAIKGLTYRPFACNCIPMPFLYPLDIVSYEELNGNIIKTVITNHNFGLNKASALSAIGETATKNNYSSRRGITKQEIDAAIREALKGVDSKAEHIYVKYSPYDGGYDENVNLVWSDTPTADTVYLGTCATNNATAPDTPLSYKWVKIRGADGTNGKDGQDGKDGKDGKGISEVINYYLTTNKADGVTRDDFGGNTEIVTPDKDKPYLWNYEEIRYTSGNPTYTDPCIIGNFAENGSNGRGIKSITEYYLTTQTESTPSKTSFKGAIQTPSLTYPFLWNYEKIEYTDDSTPYESDVRLIGVYGSDGKSLFTWVKYADDASGTNMSDDATGKKYMGIAYNKTSATESTTASDYAWSKIQGDNGRGVSKVETEYRLSTSDTSLSSGYTWGTDAPTWQDGLFLWTRLATTYTDGKTEYSDPVVDASWKKTSVVDAASKELNETLANALGLHVTEYPVGTSKIRYYHSNPSLTSSKSGDTILVFNAKGFGVCTTGWNGGNPVFQNGAEFEKGKAVWNILAANKISADLIETGSIKSLPSAKVQTTINLDDGTISSTNGETSVKIQGGYIDKNGVTHPAGIALESETEDRHFIFTPSELSFTTIEYLLALLLHELNPSRNPKPEDPYFSSIAEKDIKTTNIYCKDIYIAGTDGNEYNLLDELTLMAEETNSLRESLSALQEKYTKLLESIGQTCDHSSTITKKENVVSPTCTEPGSYDEVVYCATCGEEITDRRETITTDALGHNYTSVVTSPTETTQGYTTHTCSRCGHSYVDSYTEPTGCQHEYSVTVVEPTCTEQGYTLHTCLLCGATYKDSYTEATGHKSNPLYFTQEDVVEPTCTEPGSFTKVSLCTKCNAVLSRSTVTVDPTGHTDENGDGYCDNCSAEIGIEEQTLANNATTTITIPLSSIGSDKSDSIALTEFAVAKFVPPSDGTYTFESVSAMLTEGTQTADPWARLYNSDKSEILVVDDDTAGARMFKIEKELEGGETYYLAVKFYYANCAGTVDVKVTKQEATTPTYAEDTIVDGVLYIGLETTDINNTSAYANRTDIVSVVIPDGITSIGHLVFSDCTKLKTITIPASVISIGSAICQRCTALTDVYYKGTETQWNTISIGVNNTNLTNATIHYNS